jgi:hypothetical protein
MGSMGVFEKLMISGMVFVFGLIVYVIFIVYNTENITINGITYYCEDNYSYYYEDLGTTSTSFIPIFNGKTTMLMPTTKHDTIKRTLDYNICKTQNIQRDR